MPSDPTETTITIGATALAVKFLDYLIGRFGRSESKLEERVEGALADHKRRLEAIEKDTEHRLSTLEEFRRISESKEKT